MKAGPGLGPVQPVFAPLPLPASGGVQLHFSGRARLPFRGEPLLRRTQNSYGVLDEPTHDFSPRSRRIECSLRLPLTTSCVGLASTK